MSWNQNRYKQGFQSADYTILQQGLQAARDELEGLTGAAAVDKFEAGFRSRIESEVESANEIDDITKIKAEALINACNGAGLNAVLHCDRSPWCCRVSLEGAAHIDDSTMSIYFMLEDHDSYRIFIGNEDAGTRRPGGWKWHSQIGLNRDDAERLESDLQDFNLQVLERNWLGDDEHDTARKIAAFVALIDVSDLA